MRVWAAAGAAVVVGIGAGACGGSSDPETSTAAEVYITTVREVAGELPTEPSTEPLPVIYVLAGDGETIDAAVQAEVASALDAEVDVRFADSRGEAVDEEKAGAPVHDKGHLLTVGPVHDEAGQVDLEYELYRSDGEWSRRVVTLERVDDAWSPTSSSVLDEHVEPPSSAGAGEDDAADAEEDEDDEDDAAGTPSPSTTPASGSSTAAASVTTSIGP